jgi:hypothetical protein
MDVDITVQDELDDENDIEEGRIMSENEDKSGIESDTESSPPNSS